MTTTSAGRRRWMKRRSARRIVEVAEQLRKKAEKPRPSSGVPYATPLLFYHDWEQISGAPSPTKFGFKDAQAAFFDALQYKDHFSYYTDYQLLPNLDTGAWLLFYQAYRETYVSAGEKWPARSLSVAHARGRERRRAEGAALRRGRSTRR